MVPKVHILQPCTRAAAPWESGPKAPAPRGRGTLWCLETGKNSPLSPLLPPSTLHHGHFCTKRAAKANRDSWSRLSGEQLHDTSSPRPSGPPLCRHPRRPRAREALPAASVGSGAGLSLVHKPISRARAPTAGNANPAPPASTPPQASLHPSCKPSWHRWKYEFL